MDVAAEESLPYEPVEVVDEDGRVVRKTITVRKRIVRRIIYLPDGTKQEVEEEVPVTEAEERPAEVLELVEREVAEPSKPEEPEQKEVVPKPEEVVVPMEVATEESLPYEPEQPSYPAVEEPEEPVEEDGRVVRKTITVRKRIVRRIIRLPDGTKQEVEEEVPVEEAEERPAEVFELVEGEIREPGKPEEPQFVAVPSQPDSRVDFVPLKEPRQVERVYVTRILRQTDGTERVLETSETVSPMQPEPEDEVEEREKVEEVKDRLGRVKKTIHRSPAFVIRKKKVTKESRRILPHGKEEPEKTTAVEPEETQEVEAPVIRRVVKLVTRDSDGKEEVVEKTVTQRRWRAKVTEKREKGKNVRIVKRKLVETRQQNIRKKVTKKPDGKQEGPVEEEAIKPVEPVSYRIVRKTVRHGDGTVHVTEEPDFTMPDDAKEPTVEEVKDRRGQVVRRITTKPVPMLTRRKVYRTIIIAPDGTEESVQERVVERQEPDAPEQPAPKEEVPKKEEVVVVPMEVAAEESLPYEPVEVVDEDGRVVRKTITVRKRIVRRIIYLPDGTKQEVEEE
eukprot:gene4517-5113_t